MIAKQKLVSKVKPILQEVSLKSRLVDDVTAYMIKTRAVVPSFFSNYVYGIEPLKQIDDEILFWLVDALKQTCVNDFPELKQIRFEEYYTDREVTKYSLSKNKLEQKDLYPVRLKYMKEVSYDQWIGTVTIDELYGLYNKQLIAYNPRTQRELKKKVRGGRTAYVINVVKKSIKEIMSELSNHSFIPNTLTLNINVDDERNEFSIVDLEGPMKEIVLTKGQLDIIDGFHRFRSAILTKSDNPDFDFTFELRVTNFDENKAGRFIAQEDKRNEVNKLHINSLDTSNNVNLTVKRLNESGVLSGKIGGTGMGEIDKGILVTILSRCFPEATKDRREAMMLSQRLNEKFEEMIFQRNITDFSMKTLMVMSMSVTIEGDAIDTFNWAMDNSEKLPPLTASSLSKKTTYNKYKNVLERREV